MVTKIRGHIKGGAVIVDHPLDFPDGLEVELQITTPDVIDPSTQSYGPVIGAVFGIWRDRDDITDSTEWVRKQRNSWSNRLNHDQD